MLKWTLRSLSPFQLDKGAAAPAQARMRAVGSAASVAAQSDPGTRGRGDTERALIDALDEPALMTSGSMVRLANRAAHQLLGNGLEGRDVRLAIRQPQALELIVGRRSGELDVTGLVEPDRSWRLIVRQVGDNLSLVRLLDRSNAVAAERMRVDFVANASHELRTPLSTIIGYSETLAEDAELTPELRTSFGATIRQEAGRMLRIIEDLMSLSRIEADRFVTPTSLVSVQEVLADAINNIEPFASSRKSAIAMDLQPGLPDVRGDFGQLVQVFDNLLANAIRYGGGAAGAAAITVAAVRQAQMVRISVADSGAGIAKEHLPRLTERFYRVDAARSRGSGGTGLGLAIVKHIVERHRGTLEIASDVGVGTIVSVTLPAGGPS